MCALLDDSLYRFGKTIHEVGDLNKKKNCKIHPRLTTDIQEKHLYEKNHYVVAKCYLSCSPRSDVFVL